MIAYTLHDDDGSSEDVVLPSKFVVCDRCEGRGVHDCWEGGMTGDEMAEQGPEYLDDYLSGVYDTRCTVCDGLRVIEVVDTDRLDAGTLRRYEATEQAQREYEAEVAAERRYGY